MTIQQLTDLFLKRQSCRSFSEKPVAKEQIREICTLAGLAPSACNMQPWKVYAITGKKLAAVKALLKANGKAAFIDDAPVLLAIGEDTKASEQFRPELNLPYYTPGDVGEFTAYLVLAAEAAGLASCIIGWQNKNGIKEILDLSENVSIPWFVALGYSSDGYERGRSNTFKRFQRHYL